MAKISILSSAKAGKYEFVIDEDVILKKELLEKAAIIKRFQYLPLISELKKQADIT